MRFCPLPKLSAGRARGRSLPFRKSAEGRKNWCGGGVVCVFALLRGGIARSRAITTGIPICAAPMAVHRAQIAKTRTKSSIERRGDLLQFSEPKIERGRVAREDGVCRYCAEASAYLPGDMPKGSLCYARLSVVGNQ